MRSSAEKAEKIRVTPGDSLGHVRVEEGLEHQGGSG
jgi:hypothetical protein